LEGAGAAKPPLPSSSSSPLPPTRGRGRGWRARSRASAAPATRARPRGPSDNHTRSATMVFDATGAANLHARRPAEAWTPGKTREDEGPVTPRDTLVSRGRGKGGEITRSCCRATRRAGAGIRVRRARTRGSARAWAAGEPPTTPGRCSGDGSRRCRKVGERPRQTSICHSKDLRIRGPFWLATRDPNPGADCPKPWGREGCMGPHMR
jgi:hypothetical protein